MLSQEVNLRVRFMKILILLSMKTRNFVHLTSQLRFVKTQERKQHEEENLNKIFWDVNVIIYITVICLSSIQASPDSALPRFSLHRNKNNSDCSRMSGFLNTTAKFIISYSMYVDLTVSHPTENIALSSGGLQT